MILPILESIINIILQSLEIIKGYLQLQVKKISLKMIQIEDEISKLSDGTSVHAIGFQIPSEEDYQEEDYD